jgi:hypothetical protein
VGFWLWALVGAGAVFGAISLGPLAWIPVAAAVYLLVRRTEWNGGPVLLGLVAGAGLPLLLVAALQWNDWHHRLPGDNTPNPYDWGAVGLSVLLAGVVAYALRSSRSR